MCVIIRHEGVVGNFIESVTVVPYKCTFSAQVLNN
jgi:hypothetical protein